MWFNTHIILLCIILCLPIITVTESGVEKHNGHHVAPQTLTELNKIRCTRRFSPGACPDNVAPVWTFVFHLQNCTERLGCPSNRRSNRFRDYRMCMLRCRPLVDTYLQILEFDAHNNSHPLRALEGPWSANQFLIGTTLHAIGARRQSADESTTEANETAEEEDELATDILYEDMEDISEDIEPPNIDLHRIKYS